MSKTPRTARQILGELLAELAKSQRPTDATIALANENGFVWDGQRFVEVDVEPCGFVYFDGRRCCLQRKHPGDHAV